MTIMQRPTRMRARPVEISRVARIVRLLLIPTLLLVATDSAWALRHLKEGEPLPSFAAKGTDGAEITNKTFAGKPFIIVFARPRQPESARALREVGALLAQRKDAGLAGIAVPTGDDPDGTVQRFIREHKLPLTVVTDPERKMYGDFGIIVSPTVLFVDAKGTLRFHVPHLPPGYARVLAAHADFVLGTIDAETHAKQVSNAPDTPPAATQSLETRLAFARLLVRHGKDEDARKILAEIDFTGKPVPEAAAMLATILLDRGELTEASNLLKPYENREPMSADLHYALAQLAVAQGHPDKAAPHLAATRKEGPSQQRSNILFTMGILYEKANRLALALRCYREALEGFSARNLNDVSSPNTRAIRSSRSRNPTTRQPGELDGVRTPEPDRD